MSNLATMIMEGSMGIGSKVELAHSYDHENGAGLIAMESAEALKDIFEAEFIRRADIAAALNVITQRILKEAWFTLLRMRLPSLSMLCSIGL